MDGNRKLELKILLGVAGIAMILSAIREAAPELPASVWLLVGFLLLVGGLS
jgi:hypothetical protein